MPNPRKRFGQHWLKDASVHRAIAAAAGLDTEAIAGQVPHPGNAPCVLEIGPGTGQLTRRLLAAGAKVVGVEIDRKLCQVLRTSLGDRPNFTLIEADVLHQPLPSEPSLVVANIPYNITSPILDKVLGSPDRPVTQFSRIVLLVQLELAERLCAQPHSKPYGAMTVRCQYLADCVIVRTVSRKAFQPPPNVESAIISLTPRPWPHPAHDPRWFSVLVKQGFATRRKQLANTLQSLTDKAVVRAALEHLGLDPLSRAEALSVGNWVDLSNRLLNSPADPEPGQYQSDPTQPEPNQPPPAIAPT